MKTLVIMIEFSDETDFDYFRDRFVGACEDVAVIALEGDDETHEPARADGTIVVSWDVED